MSTIMNKTSGARVKKPVPKVVAVNTNLPKPNDVKKTPNPMAGHGGKSRRRIRRNRATKRKTRRISRRRSRRRSRSRH